VVAAALVFVFAGTAMLINSLVTPYRDALLRINSALLLGSFAGVPLGIAWSTGAEWPLVLAGLLCLGLATLAVGWGIADAWRIMRERKGRPTTG
jgi:hypothetical protein